MQLLSVHHQHCKAHVELMVGFGNRRAKNHERKPNEREQTCDSAERAEANPSGILERRR